MSLIPLVAGGAGGGVRALGTPALGAVTRGVGRLLGRGARRRARGMVRGAPVRPGLLETGLGLVTGRPVRGRAALMPGMRRRRRRGISATELRGFKKVAMLLADFGMRPRGLAGGRAMRRRRTPFSRRRFGDFEGFEGEE